MPALNSMQKIEHIGIAVKDLQVSIPLFEKLLNTPCYKKESVETEQVETAFFQCGQSKIELVASASNENAISKFIDKRGEGIHHIAFQVKNLEVEMQRLRAAGFKLIYDKPREGADNKMVCFLHPSTTNGVLVELVADKIQEG